MGMRHWLTRRARRALCVLCVLCSTALLLACAGSNKAGKSALDAPVQSTTIGPGDTFTMQIVGEKDLPAEFKVASDGTVDLPYIQRQHVAGLEPQELQSLIRRELIAGKILQDPSVVVRVTAYDSKRVTVLGQVQKPGSFPLDPGLTLLQVISLAGGLNSIADTGSVSLTRTNGSRTTTVEVSFDDIAGGEAPDIKLQAGDKIYVRQRVF